MILCLCLSERTDRTCEHPVSSLLENWSHLEGESSVSSFRHIQYTYASKKKNNKS
jgi:hypothetical protein